MIILWLLIFSHEDDKVNIEVDVLAKMVERSLSGVYENNSKNANSVETIAKLEERVEALESTILKMQKDIAFLLLKWIAFTWISILRFWLFRLLFILVEFLKIGFIILFFHQFLILFLILLFFVCLTKNCFTLLKFGFSVKPLFRRQHLILIWLRRFSEKIIFWKRCQYFGPKARKKYFSTIRALTGMCPSIIVTFQNLFFVKMKFDNLLSLLLSWFILQNCFTVLRIFCIIFSSLESFLFNTNKIFWESVKSELQQ